MVCFPVVQLAQSNPLGIETNPMDMFIYVMTTLLALTYVFMPYKSPTRFFFSFVFGSLYLSLILLKVNSHENSPYATAVYTAATYFIVGFIWGFYIRDFAMKAESQTIKSFISCMDAITGVPWWSKSPDIQPRKKTYRPHCMANLLLKMQKKYPTPPRPRDNNKLVMDVPVTIRDHRNKQEEEPEVLKHTTQKVIGQDGREYTFEHKLTVKPADGT